jgi:ABC-type phosphate transport system, periplasmic component
MIIARKIPFFLLFTIFLIFYSCEEKKKSDKWQDTVTTGVIPIVSDEAFQPIIDSEIMVFESIYPMAGIVPIYTNEVEAMDLLMNDSVRFAIMTRTLTEGEKAAFLERKRMVREIKIAVDAIALIVHEDNPYSYIGVPTLKKILLGEVSEWKEIDPESKLGKIEVLFDHQNSSMVRYMIDSICGGKTFSENANLYAQGNHDAVVNMVSKSPNSLGVIGVNWISNENDSTNMSFLEKIKVLAVSKYDYVDEYNSYLPYQAYIALGDYPMTRDVYILLSDPRTGLSSGFASFVASDRGQRIILKSGLFPATQPVNLVHVRNQPLTYK